MFYKRFLGMSDESKPNLGFCARVLADTLARLIFLVNYPNLLSILPNDVLFSRLFLLFGIKMFFKNEIFSGTLDF